jgi:hypothetical protein
MTLPRCDNGNTDPSRRAVQVLSFLLKQLFWKYIYAYIFKGQIASFLKLVLLDLHGHTTITEMKFFIIIIIL